MIRVPHVINVLVVSGQYPPNSGGIGDYVRCLVNALSDVGQNVSLVVPEGSDLSDTNATHVGTISRWGWSSLTTIARLLDKVPVDWLHIQFNTNIYGGHPAICLLPDFLRMRGWKGSIAVTFHDLQKPYLFPKAGRLRDWLLGRLAQSANIVLAADTGDVLALQGLNSCVQQVPIGSNIPARNDIARGQIDALRKTYGIPSDVLLIGHFGTSIGLDTLVDALAQIPDAILLLIGKYLPEEPSQRRSRRETVPDYIVKKIEQLNVLKRIRWTGYLPGSAVALALAACNVVALPYPGGASLRHGGLMAALAQGCAVISTIPKHPMPGLVDGEHLLFVPPGDASALAEGIRNVGSNSELRARLQENARQAALTVFSWPRIAQMHAAIYYDECAANQGVSTCRTIM